MIIEAAKDYKPVRIAQEYKDKGYKILCVVLPVAGEWVYRRFLESMLSMCAGDAYNYFLADKVKMVIQISTDFPIDHNRNKGILAAKHAWLADYIMQVDTDQTFHSGTIMELYERMHRPAPDGSEIEAISGMYFMKRFPFRPVVGRYAGEWEDGMDEAMMSRHGFVCRGECGRPEHKLGASKQLVRWTSPQTWRKDGIWRADVIGVGCVLTRASMWDKLDFPYFKYAPDPVSGPKYNEMAAISEDMYWCAQMHKKGVQVWVDPIVQCGHIGIIESDQNLFENAFSVTKKAMEERPDTDAQKKQFMGALLHAD